MELSIKQINWETNPFLFLSLFPRSNSRMAPLIPLLPLPPDPSLFKFFFGREWQKAHKNQKGGFGTGSEAASDILTFLSDVAF